jgi:hypothetical protein
MTDRDLSDSLVLPNSKRKVKNRLLKVPIHSTSVCLQDNTGRALQHLLIDAKGPND